MVEFLLVNDPALILSQVSFFFSLFIYELYDIGVTIGLKYITADPDFYFYCYLAG